MNAQTNRALSELIFVLTYFNLDLPATGSGPLLHSAGGRGQLLLGSVQQTRLQGDHDMDSPILGPIGSYIGILKRHRLINIATEIIYSDRKSDGSIFGQHTQVKVIHVWNRINNI